MDGPVKTAILNIVIRYEQDVVLARKRARQIAKHLNYDVQDQIRIATAVSEMARNAFQYAGGGRVAFALEPGSPDRLTICVSDTGPGIADVASVLAGNHRSTTGMGLGLRGAMRLVDEFNISSEPETGTSIHLIKALPPKTTAPLMELAAALVTAVMQESPQNSYEEMQGQNQELLAALDEVQRQKLQLGQLNDQLSAALEKAEAASHAKTEFLANMSHEIRTPMNAVVGLANLLGRTELSPQQAKFVSTLQKSAESMTGFVNDLLDVSKIENNMVVLEHIPFDLRELIARVVDMSAVGIGRKDVKISHDFRHMTGSTFCGDPQRIHQVVLNLVSNAVKFTSTGDVIVSVNETWHADGTSDLSIDVEDTGIGIAPEALDKIFEKFVQADSTTTRRFGGTGLGLSIARSLAHLMGGGLSVRSEVGEGSVFTLSVALERAGERIDGPYGSAYETVGRRRRILIVEDSDANIIVATTLLEDLGHTVFAVKTGFGAVEFLASEPVDLILMDIQMQDMDGFEATKHIRARETSAGVPPCPIVATTAYELPVTRQTCLDAGMNDFVPKPIVAGQLQAVLMRQL